MNKITIIIPTSPIPSHPDTAILDKTLATVRHHLPTAEVILQIDGLRDEQKDRKADYDEYKNRVLWKCLHEWNNVLPVVFDEHCHQSDMLRQTTELITTPLLMYVEADTPLRIDRTIDFEAIADFILSGNANTVRLHHEEVIPKEHNDLMLGKSGQFLRTMQWSQRPHVSSVLYYTDTILPTLPAKSFIEDTFHGIVYNDYQDHEMQGWYKHRLWIYAPKGGLQRSTHLDGRAGGLKFTADDKANK